jgi:hypothetical protein
MIKNTDLYKGRTAMTSTMLDVDVSGLVAHSASRRNGNFIAAKRTRRSDVVKRASC